jgi:hypothetical protein
MPVNQPDRSRGEPEMDDQDHDASAAPLWRVCVVVTPETHVHLASTVANLRRCGFRQLHVYVPQGLHVATDDLMIKVRIPRHLIGGLNTAAAESYMFCESLLAVGGAMITDSELLLFLGADLCLWNDFARFAEATVERNFIGAYFPYTPKPFFMGTEYHLPGNRLGWYGFMADDALAGASCLAMNRHTAGLLGSVIRDMREQDPDSWQTEPWQFRLKEALWCGNICCYGAGTSMAYRWGDQIAQENSVPTDGRLIEGFEQYGHYY